MPKLDQLDRALIAVLQENARLSNQEIAERVNSTEPTVRRRIERLVRADVIKIVAVANPFQLGHAVVAILGMQIDRHRLAEIEQALLGMPEVRFAGMTIGNYDIVAEAWFADNAALLAFLNECLTRVPGLLRVEPLQVLKMIKYAYDWGKQPSA